jgi:hypothetical protein
MRMNVVALNVGAIQLHQRRAGVRVLHAADLDDELFLFGVDLTVSGPDAVLYLWIEVR